MQFVIGGLKKTSLLDYPDKVSAIVFTQGCNFNCGYCHNPSLLEFKTKNDICSTDVFFEFLNKRIGKLDGVVITGGEPTLQKDLKPFIQKIKDMNFLVKLDTNGTNPEIVRDLLKDNLLDYIAMDIKAPLEKYKEVVCTNVNTDNIQKSVDLIKSSNLDYEFRTTVLPSLLSYDDFEKIGVLIKGAKKYFLQKFVVQSGINNSELVNEKNYSDNEFEEIKNILFKYIDFVEVR
jgi:pyruvate formate lyase activating enzyme